MTRLELPYPPSVNKYWRHVLRGRYLKVYVSGNGKAFHALAHERIIAQIGARWKPLSGRVRVHVLAHPPTRHRADLDNLLKPLLDTLTHAHIWLDDSQVDSLTIERGPVVRGGKIIMHISEIPQAGLA